MILHDKDIREPLFDFLEQTFGKTRILEEMNIGKSRADVVMVTDTALFGVEIKSDADTYARLEGQVKDYDHFFDRNIVVVGTSHAAHIKEHVPEHWGIVTVEVVEQKMDFYVLRDVSPNPKVSWKNKIKFLWREELACIQNIHGMPKYRQMSKAFVRAKILDALAKGKIAEDELQKEFCELLFERDYTLL